MCLNTSSDGVLSSFYTKITWEKNMRGLTNKSALVTGGGAGIGRATCIRLAEEGARVAVADINAETAREVADDINRAGGTAIALVADVGDTAQCGAMVAAVAENFGGIDILVNNAGMPARNQTGEPFDIWNRGVDITMSSAFRISELALPYLLKSSNSAIVNVSSVAGTHTFGLGEWYSAAKAGLTGLTRSYAGTYGEKGLRVNAVSFGFIKTQRNKMSWDDPQSIRRSALRRNGDPEEAASTIAFLVSDDASFITGEVLTVDGGFHIT
jgi:NAD(P)-dependent dehydrogenase (short-subunit alcohol dehydrogenase family)